MDGIVQVESESIKRTPNDEKQDEKGIPESAKIADEWPSNPEPSSSSVQGRFGASWSSAWSKFSEKSAWVGRNWSWKRLKPVIRCALAAWLSSILFIVPRVQKTVGNASFLILIAAFLSPPSDPFMSVVEREMLILSFVTTAWAWSCLGIFLANLARTVHNSSVTFAQATSTAEYIEAVPTVIIAIFIFFGSAVPLYIKARAGQGPYVFASVFACICTDISLTAAVFFPYPLYALGKAIVLPLALHTAIALIASVLVFPSTMSAQFTARLQDILSPLIKAIELHRTLLDTPVSSPSFSSRVGVIHTSVEQCEAGLVPLAASSRLLKSDLIYGRFSPEDFKSFQEMSRRIAGRANGLGMYFNLIGGSKERFPGTPALFTPQIPGNSTPATQSRNHSSERSKHVAHDKDPHSQIEASSTGPLKPDVSGHSQRHSRHHKHHRHTLHHSLAALARPRTKEHEHVVGTFESQRYLNLEATRLHDPHAEVYISRATELLQESCDGLLGACHEGLTQVHGWLGTVREHRFDFWIDSAQRKRHLEERLEKYRGLREKVSCILEEFRSDKRLLVLEPYRSIFQDGAGSEDLTHVPPHRCLFNCYVYQYHLIQISSIVVEMIDGIIKLEELRPQNRLWTPMRRIFTWNPWFISEDAGRTEDDDPNVIQGLPLDHGGPDDLDLPKKRDPDALPPGNVVEWVFTVLYDFVSSLGGANVLYAIKAGLFTVVLCLPYFLKSSAVFAYANRFVWAVLLGQLTLTRFQGETAFNLTARIISTFLGGIVGMVMWYMSGGHARGSSFGLAAVFAVCFPPFFYIRLYCPIPAMTNIVFFVTVMLVVGYSYQDAHTSVLRSPGVGWDIAWKRFVTVTCGVIAAFIMSFLPPSTTIRQYHRSLLSTTSVELGSIYCSILSFASTKHDPDIQEILSSLIAVRSKLNRSLTLRTNVMYERSLRGRWPLQRYQRILELQVAISYSLSHLTSVLEHLEPNWARAFLRRTRFMDPDFQGDVLAIFSMISSSLRTGCPLPQITPCPLLDRFMFKYHGLDVIHKDAEEDYGLPRLLTLETLQNEQYLMFSVGIATAFGIINRLDQLMVAAKEVVGEHYHIHGVGFVSDTKSGIKPGGTSTVHIDPPKDT